MPAAILVVDDEKNIQLTLSRALSMEGYVVEAASGGREALEKIAALPVDVVVMDVRMPDLDGLAVLQKARETRPDLPVVIMSGHGSIETVRSAFKLGAFDYLEKPITEKDKLLVAVKNALALRSLREENAELRRAAGRLEMVGSGPAMQRLFELVRRAAPSEGRVLVTGENGTGKELVARAIHESSRRKAGPFVKLNCAAVPAELIESELFGHERGAFTGAVAARRGKFELADGGTLFLDEVGDMPAAMQAKVLRVLQEGEFERVGGTQTLRVDVRVVAATNKDLAGGGAGGPLPRGPLLPAERRPHPRAAAARAEGGRPRARDALPRRGVRTERPAAHAARARRARRAPDARLARQRPRAAGTSSSGSRSSATARRSPQTT